MLILITLENGKAGNDARGEAAYAAEFFRWFSEAVRVDGLITPSPQVGIVVQHKPAGIAVLDYTLELPSFGNGTRKVLQHWQRAVQ